MAIEVARIDNRLLHGIVATQWVPQYNVQRVMVIDDHTADNPMIKESMKMSKPAGKALSIINRQTAYENFKNKKYDGQTIFLIVKDPQIILDLLNLGEKIPTVIIGATVEPEPGVEYLRIHKRACVTADQKPIYQAIMDFGSEVEAKLVPQDKTIYYKNLI